MFSLKNQKDCIEFYDDKRMQSINSMDTHTEWVKISYGRYGMIWCHHLMTPKKLSFTKKPPKFLLCLPPTAISLAVSVPSGHETSFGCSMDVQKTSMATGLNGHQICYSDGWYARSCNLRFKTFEFLFSLN